MTWIPHFNVQNIDEYKINVEYQNPSLWNINIWESESKAQV